MQLVYQTVGNWKRSVGNPKELWSKTSAHTRKAFDFKHQIFGPKAQAITFIVQQATIRITQHVSFTMSIMPYILQCNHK